METHKAEIQPSNIKPWGIDLKQFLVLMHIAQFAGYIIPFAGFVLPIIMWTSFKDNNDQIEVHGKNIINFMITFFIYAIIAGVLCFLLIGVPLLLVLTALGVLFPILGAIKAGNNEIYEYPATIKFLK